MKGLFKLTYRFLLAALCLSLLQTSSSTEQSITRENMLSDINYLSYILKTVHPQVKSGWLPEQKQRLEEIKRGLPKRMPVEGFYFKINALLMTLHDAHSSARLGIRPGDRFAELPIFWGDDGMMVVEDTGQLRKGDRIVSIGGKTEEQILNRFQQLVPAENEYWVKARAAQLIVWEPYLVEAGLMRKSKSVLKATINREGKTRQARIPFTTSWKHVVKLYQASPVDEVQALSYRLFPDESLAVFRLDNCAVDEPTQQAIREFFQAVDANHLRNVAIDVRRNGGGNSAVIKELFSYTTIKHYMGFSGVDQVSGKPERTLASRTSVIPAKGISPFSGHLYILTSNQTFSSANWLATLVQDNHLGTVVGEPTGNQPTSFGDINVYTLPESGITVSVSQTAWTRPDRDSSGERTVWPDIVIDTTAQDIRNGIDSQINGLIRLLQKQ
ncbi:S41 family peptidase [Gorillibacterium sp. sgz500922]|uniref:S41 family peptidase n=1 Tax=Gorillibacterium sp. sgz500922 TaxID=3446694 RepID=UPI003F67F926